MQRLSIRIARHGLKAHYITMMQGYENIVISNSIHPDYSEYPGFFSVLYGSQSRTQITPKIEFSNNLC